MAICPQCGTSLPDTLSFCPHDGIPLHVRPSPSITDIFPLGSIIGERYKLLTPLAVGGMGAVYRAEHILMKRQVAVKLLRPDLADLEESKLRFMREARLCAQLDHPNCVTVYDFGAVSEDIFFLAMEFLEGESLAARIERDGPLEAVYAVEIFCQVLDALHAAHQLGIVHRDIKPANIMLIEQKNGTERVKLLDFGIAKAPKKREEQIGESSFATETPITLHGLTVGTPEYISPEQALGQEADGRADLYSLGVSLLEVLTGKLPFISASPVAIVTSHVNDPPPRPREIAHPDFPISPALEQVILHSLSKKPDDRFLHAEEFRACLLDAVPEAVPPDFPSEISVVRRIPDGIRPATPPQTPVPVESPPTPPDPVSVQNPLTPPSLTDKTLISNWELKTVSENDLSFPDAPPPSFQNISRSSGSPVAFLLIALFLFALLGLGGWYVFVYVLPQKTVEETPVSQAVSWPVTIDIRPAKKLLAQRDFAGVVSDLKPQIAKAPKSEEAILLLGHAYAGLEEWSEAQNSYFQATKIEPSLCNNDMLLLGTIDMLTLKEESLQNTARELLVFCGDRVVSALIRAVTMDTRKPVKQHGLEALKTMEENGLDIVPFYLEALQKAETCEQRLIWVEQLHHTMDPRILKPLQKENRRKGNRCLKSEVLSAIRDVKKRK